MMPSYQIADTIIAPSTPAGQGAIAVIRVSGPEAIPITERLCQKSFNDHKGYTAHFCKIKDEENQVVDEVIATLFRNPHSYTKEDVVEISCHGSSFIVKRILQLYQKAGARLAEAGEFTMRAYMNGQLDLSQAEAVADLIAAESSKAHELAIKQLRGGFSNEIQELRHQLINFASLIELELDFGEEDVEFADREDLTNTVEEIQAYIQTLLQSFKWGNAFKNGVQTVIAGRPNAGKSTLLNALLKEDRAIVSDIPGTTRDTIEEEMILEGVKYRFIDTAGIRDAEDAIEALGVNRTYEKIAQSAIVLFVYDHSETTLEELRSDLAQFVGQSYNVICVANKVDKKDHQWSTDEIKSTGIDGTNFISISAKNNEGISQLTKTLIDLTIAEGLSQSGTFVTNERHYHALQQALEDLARVQEGLQTGVTGDFIAMDIRQALYHLGSIIGKVDVDEDILGTIFGKFCIGK